MVLFSSHLSESNIVFVSGVMTFLRFMEEVQVRWRMQRQTSSLVKMSDYGIDLLNRKLGKDYLRKVLPDIRLI